jgi:hypothetical protein
LTEARVRIEGIRAVEDAAARIRLQEFAQDSTIAPNLRYLAAMLRAGSAPSGTSSDALVWLDKAAAINPRALAPRIGRAAFRHAESAVVSSSDRTDPDKDVWYQYHCSILTESVALEMRDWIKRAGQR